MFLRLKKKKWIPQTCPDQVRGQPHSQRQQMERHFLKTDTEWWSHSFQDKERTGKHLNVIIIKTEAWHFYFLSKYLWWLHKPCINALNSTVSSFCWREKMLKQRWQWKRKSSVALQDQAAWFLFQLLPFRLWELEQVALTWFVIF